MLLFVGDLKTEMCWGFHGINGHRIRTQSFLQPTFSSSTQRNRIPSMILQALLHLMSEGNFARSVCGKNDCQSCSCSNQLWILARGRERSPRALLSYAEYGLSQVQLLRISDLNSVQPSACVKTSADEL